MLDHAPDHDLTYRRNDESRPPSEVISELLAEDVGDVTELPPLSESVDPDALDAIFATRADGTRRVGGAVSFDHAGYHITVEREGEYVIRVEQTA